MRNLIFGNLGIFDLLFELLDTLELPLECIGVLNVSDVFILPSLSSKSLNTGLFQFLKIEQKK